MPISKSAIKRLRQSKARNLSNKAAKSYFKTTLKKVRAAISDGNRENAQTALSSAISIIDKSVSKGVVHKNAASRYKSRLTKQVNTLPVT
jgi:small subunit ribosomal protein S20